MDPTTIIAIGTTAFSIGEKLDGMISHAIGNGALALHVINASQNTTLYLEYQSGVGDKGSHGKWIGDKHPILTIKPKESSQFESSKSKKAASGNTNGVVYKAVKAGCPPAYLWIVWCMPYLGRGYYRIEWKDTWDAKNDPNKLLADVKKSKKDFKDSNHTIDGLQKVSSPKGYNATGTFGTAPLKVVVHD